MPNKSHRRASKQAKLSKRKRRGTPNIHQFDPGPTESSSSGQVEGTDSGKPLETESVATSPSPIIQSALSYNYLNSEMWRIGVLTSLMVAILVVLTVFLRN